MRLFICTLMASLFGFSSTWASYGFNKVDAKYVRSSEQIPSEPISMPPFSSQDSAGVCYSFAAAAVLDQALCKKKGIADCKQMTDDQRVSPVDLSRYSKLLPDSVDSSDRFNYEGLQFDGGSTAVVIQNALLTQQMVKSSCAPFDQFVSKIDDPQTARDAELKVLNDLKKSYENYTKKLKKSKDDAQAYAESESKRLGKDCGLKTSQKEILEAFGQTTYEKFLDYVMVPAVCWEFENQTSLRNAALDIFPTNESKKKTNYNELSVKIKEVLATGRPVVLAFCAQEPLTVKTAKECDAGHAVPIVGFSKACDKKGKCIDLVKVHNSWGAKWQKFATDDGWVDAKKLLDRSFYEPQSLSWIKDE